MGAWWDPRCAGLLLPHTEPEGSLRQRRPPLSEASTLGNNPQADTPLGRGDTAERSRRVAAALLVSAPSLPAPPRPWCWLFLATRQRLTQ